MIGSGWADIAVAIAMVQPGTESNDVWEGWGSVILIAGSTLVSIAIIGVLAWQGLKIWQTKMTISIVAARDDAYRKLAEEATAAQQRTAEEQQKAAEELAELRVRLSAIEKLLREVG